MTDPSRRQRGTSRGFSLVEMLVTLVIMSIVIAGVSAVLIRASLSRVQASGRFESLQSARAALDQMAHDIRCAGFGADRAAGQPAIAYVDSMQIILACNLAPYPDPVTSAPLAYDPEGLPRPHPLVASAWTPPQQYATGAELIRYTLDLDNDGDVDADDQATAEAVDARRTRDPDDFTLVRQVYGGGSGGVADDNGGVAERMALVRRPGGGTAPLFTVYFTGSDTPWDWSDGPVPVAQLATIDRVQLSVTSASPRAGSDGRFATTALATTVRAARNAPDFASGLATIEGWVYEEQDLDGLRDTGEPGISGGVVTLTGGRTVFTNSDGYFAFRVPAGSYTVRHIAPAGYGLFTTPDSIVVSAGAGTIVQFADTARTGGTVLVTVFSDDDADGVRDPGEGGVASVVLELGPEGTLLASGGDGAASGFVGAGAYTITLQLPSGYTLTTTNPVAGTMAAGGSASAQFGLAASAATGIIAGTVFQDTDGDGLRDAGESGRSGVTVTVTTGGGTSVASAVTDAQGAYTMTVPATSGGGTYTVSAAAVSGLVYTTPSAWTGQTLASGATLTRDFGLASYTSSSINTKTVYALLAVDLWENDGPSSSSWSRGDLDLVVANAPNTSGGQRLEYFYNAWTGGASLYPSNKDVDLNPPRYAICLAADSLNMKAPTGRTDVVAGFTHASGYNFAVYTNTGTSTAQSFLSTFATQDAGTVTVVATAQLTSGARPEVIVGTQTSATSGTVEVWLNNETSPSNGSVSLTRQERYPASGSVPGGTMGAVQAMLLADLDGDGLRDLVVGTSTGTYSGQVLVFRNLGTSGSNRFTCQYLGTLSSDRVQALAALDVDHDGWTDVVLGTRTADGTGRLVVLRNKAATVPGDFEQTQVVSAAGAVTAMATGQLTGDSRPDLVVGHITNSSSNAGGVRLYAMDAPGLPSTGIDPSNGSLTHGAFALAIGHLNAYALPSFTSPTSARDIAAGTRETGGAAKVWLFVR